MPCCGLPIHGRLAANPLGEIRQLNSDQIAFECAITRRIAVEEYLQPMQ